MGRRLCGLGMLFGVLLAGCGAKSPPSAGADGASAPPISKSTSDEFHYDDPCSLLEPKEVEAVFGAPLGTPPYRANNTTPAADGPDCVYQIGNFEHITFSVEFRDGAQAYRIGGFAKKLLGGAPTESAKKALTLDDGTELAGEWDEAQLVAMNCCIFNALRADQMVSIDFTDSQASLRQAASLVDAAFKRMDKPLKIDGGANIQAAKAFLQTRPKEVDPCTLLTRSEVEAVLGPLIAAPKSNGTHSCEYPLAPQGGMPRTYELIFDWRGGNAAFRSDAHVVRIAGMAMGGASTREDPSLPAAAADEPWERAGVSYNDFVAIKKDVRVKIDQRLLDRDKVKALVAQVMRKI